MEDSLIISNSVEQYESVMKEEPTEQKSVTVFEKIKAKFRKVPNIGFCLGGLASFHFALVGVLTKDAAVRGCHPFQMLALAKVINATGLLLLILIFKREKPFILKDIPYLLGFSILISSAVGLIFLSRNYLSALEGTVIQDSHCVFTMIISTIFFKYKPNLMDGLVAISMATGIVFISQPEFIFGVERNESVAVSAKVIGSFLALGSSFSGSCFSCFKVQITHLSPFVVSSMTSFFIFAVYAPICVLIGEWRFFTDARIIIDIVVCGVAITFASLLQLLAIDLDSVVKVAFGMMFCVPFTAVIQFSILQDIPGITTCIGIGFVIIGTFIVTCKKNPDD